MNFKILETNAFLPDLLVYRDESEDGAELVIIHAYGFEDNETSETLNYETIEFQDSESAKSFIKDYSIESAQRWLENRNLKYSTDKK